MGSPKKRRLGMCPHCNCEMECVNEARQAYLCEICLHEQEAPDPLEPRLFKSKAALNKWRREERKKRRRQAQQGIRISN